MKTHPAMNRPDSDKPVAPATASSTVRNWWGKNSGTAKRAMSSTIVAMTRNSIHVNVRSLVGCRVGGCELRLTVQRPNEISA